MRIAARYTNALAQKENLDPGDLSRPACTLSPTLSRKLNGRGARRSNPSTALAVGVYGQSLNRERVWLWVSAPLPDTQTRWRSCALDDRQRSKTGTEPQGWKPW